MTEARVTRHGAAVVGAGAGLVAAAAAAGIVAGRRLGWHRTRLAGSAELGCVHGAPLPVRTEDGVDLYAETDGPATGADVPAVVFVHGYALNLDAWHFQHEALRATHRVVLYDQRSHGRSARGSPERSTIDQLGRDLGAVLDAAVPDRPVVLVGHSMGGMTIMALAAQRPELLGSRVVGVGLLATSAGGLTSAPFGVSGPPARILQRSVPAAMAALARAPRLVETGRRAGGGLAYLATRQLGFGGPVPASYVEFTDEMLSATPVEVVAAFLPGFAAYDEYDALAALRGVPALVMCGSRDRVTPVQHSREIAARLSSADLRILPDVGHMLMLERSEEVTGAIRSLIDRTGASEAA